MDDIKALGELYEEYYGDTMEEVGTAEVINWAYDWDLINQNEYHEFHHLAMQHRLSTV